MNKLWVLLTLGAVALPGAAGAREDLADLERTILEAPGPVGCSTNTRPVRITDCRRRQAAVSAFRTLWARSPERARRVVVARFQEIPSPRGAYLPILLSVIAADEAFVPYLVYLHQKKPDSAIGAFARQAATRIRTGSCEQPQEPRFAELCSVPPAGRREAATGGS